MLWWIFRTRKTLWTNFIWNKHCKKVRPQLDDWKGGLTILKEMIEARDIFDQEILWEPRVGHSSVWFDYWT